MAEDQATEEQTTEAESTVEAPATAL